MSTTTKRKYAVHSESPRLIAEREPFRNSTGNLRGTRVTPTVHYGAGWLTGAERLRFFATQGMRYVVWSFDTPIAWWSEETGWHIVSQRFSPITSSKHQSRLYLIPTWDAESVAYALDDCKHWGTPGPDCSGPRVGKVVRDGVILCEGHYNSTP